MKKTTFIIFVGIIFSSYIIGQTKLTENTLRIDKEQKGAKASVLDMEWMAGTWTGKGLGGNVREVWTKTESGAMIGMFALTRQNRSVFYEFLTFTIEEESLLLKLKHFNPDMVGWEDKDKTVNFRFIKRDANRYYFQGLTFENAGPNNLNIYLVLRQKGKSPTEFVFRLKRAD